MPELLEAAAAIAGGERGIAASVAAIDQQRRSLVRSAPKGEPARTYWAHGIWIASHD